jgi:hypothetical protein
VPVRRFSVWLAVSFLRTWEPGIETGTGPWAPWYRAREAEATVFHQKLFCWLGWNVLRLPRPINHLGFLLKQTTLTRAMY